MAKYQNTDPTVAPVPSAKAVTFITFGVFLVLCGLFFVGLVQFNADIFTLLEGIVDNMNDGVDRIGKNIGEGCMLILESVAPLFVLLFVLVIAVKMIFCWIPLARVHSIGWSRASIKMGVKLRKLVGWVLSYFVFMFTIYGKDTVTISLYGYIALGLIALFMVGRVLLDCCGKKDRGIRIALNTISSVLHVAFFAFIFLSGIYYITADGKSLWGHIFDSLGSVINAITGKAEGPDTLSRDVMIMLSLLALFIAVNVAKAALKKQITMNKSGLRKSAVFWFIWVAVATALHYFAYKLPFAVWKATPSGELLFNLSIYGAAGILLIILTAILCCIGKKKKKEREAEVAETVEAAEVQEVDAAEETAEIQETDAVEEVTEPVESAEVDETAGEIAVPIEESSVEDTVAEEPVEIADGDPPVAYAEGESGIGETGESEQE